MGHGGGCAFRDIEDGVQPDLGRLREYGAAGVHCTHGPNKEEFLGTMLYNRVSFHDDLYAITLGGGFMNNPGRYLALTPPINGATAVTASPYFTQQPRSEARISGIRSSICSICPRIGTTWWDGGDVPAFERAVPGGAGRHHAPRRQQRLTRKLRGGSRRYVQRQLHRRRLVPGPSHPRDRRRGRRDGEI